MCCNYDHLTNITKSYKVRHMCLNAKRVVPYVSLSYTRTIHWRPWVYDSDTYVCQGSTVVSEEDTIDHQWSVHVYDSDTYCTMPYDMRVLTFSLFQIVCCNLRAN